MAIDRKLLQEKKAKYESLLKSTIETRNLAIHNISRLRGALGTVDELLDALADAERKKNKERQ